MTLNTPFSPPRRHVRLICDSNGYTHVRLVRDPSTDNTDDTDSESTAKELRRPLFSHHSASPTGALLPTHQFPFDSGRSRKSKLGSFATPDRSVLGGANNESVRTGGGGRVNPATNSLSSELKQRTVGKIVAGSVTPMESSLGERKSVPTNLDSSLALGEEMTLEGDQGLPRSVTMEQSEEQKNGTAASGTYSEQNTHDAEDGPSPSDGKSLAEVTATTHCETGRMGYSPSSKESSDSTNSKRGLVSRRGGRCGSSSPSRSRQPSAGSSPPRSLNLQPRKVSVSRDENRVPPLESSIPGGGPNLRKRSRSEVGSTSLSAPLGSIDKNEQLQKGADSSTPTFRKRKPFSITCDTSLGIEATSPLPAPDSESPPIMNESMECDGGADADRKSRRSATPPTRLQMKEDSPDSNVPRRSSTGPGGRNVTFSPPPPPPPPPPQNDKKRAPSRSPPPSEQFRDLPSFDASKLSSPAGILLSPYSPSPSTYGVIGDSPMFDQTKDELSRRSPAPSSRRNSDSGTSSKEKERGSRAHTPTNFASDFGKSPLRSPPFDGNVLSWLNSPTARGLFSPGGLTSSTNTPRGMFGPRTPGTPGGDNPYFFGDDPGVPPSPKNRESKTNDDQGEGKKEEPKSSSSSSSNGISSMICISPLASSKRNGPRDNSHPFPSRKHDPNTPINYHDVFDSPKYPTPRGPGNRSGRKASRPQSLPMLGDEPSKGKVKPRRPTRDRSDAKRDEEGPSEGTTPRSLDVVHMAERELMEDEDLSVLLQLANTTPGGANDVKQKDGSTGTQVFRSQSDPQRQTGNGEQYKIGSKSGELPPTSLQLPVIGRGGSGSPSKLSRKTAFRDGPNMHLDDFTPPPLSIRSTSSTSGSSRELVPASRGGGGSFNDRNSALDGNPSGSGEVKNSGNENDNGSLENSDKKQPTPKSKRSTAPAPGPIPNTIHSSSTNPRSQAMGPSQGHQHYTPQNVPSSSTKKYNSKVQPTPQYSMPPDQGRMGQGPMHPSSHSPMHGPGPRKGPPPPPLPHQHNMPPHPGSHPHHGHPPPYTMSGPAPAGLEQPQSSHPRHPMPPHQHPNSSYSGPPPHGYQHHHHPPPHGMPHHHMPGGHPPPGYPPHMVHYPPMPHGAPHAPHGPPHPPPPHQQQPMHMYPNQPPSASMGAMDTGFNKSTKKPSKSKSPKNAPLKRLPVITPTQVPSAITTTKKSKKSSTPKKNGSKKGSSSSKTTNPGMSDPLDRQKTAATIAAVNAASGGRNDRAAALAAAILRGVTMRPSGKWQAQLYYAGKSRYIGVFDTREKAALAYEIAREKLKSDNKTPADQSAQTIQATEAAVNSARKAAFEGVNEKDPRLAGKIKSDL